MVETQKINNLIFTWYPDIDSLVKNFDIQISNFVFNAFKQNDIESLKCELDNLNYHFSIDSNICNIRYKILILHKMIEILKLNNVNTSINWFENKVDIIINNN